jgi:hypothetical protein
MRQYHYETLYNYGHVQAPRFKFSAGLISYSLKGTSIRQTAATTSNAGNADTEGINADSNADTDNGTQTSGSSLPTRRYLELMGVCELPEAQGSEGRDAVGGNTDAVGRHTHHNNVTCDERMAGGRRAGDIDCDGVEAHDVEMADANSNPVNRAASSKKNGTEQSPRKRNVNANANANNNYERGKHMLTESSNTQNSNNRRARPSNRPFQRMPRKVPRNVPRDPHEAAYKDQCTDLRLLVKCHFANSEYSRVTFLLQKHSVFNNDPELRRLVAESLIANEEYEVRLVKFQGKSLIANKEYEVRLGNMR